MGSDWFSPISLGPDYDIPAPGQEFAQFGLATFCGAGLAYQTVPGVTKTEVGYSRGVIHNPTYDDVKRDTTGHSQVVRVQYHPKECSYETLLNLFWAQRDLPSLILQAALSSANCHMKVGVVWNLSGIYCYTPEQEKAARESMQKQEKLLRRKIWTKINPARKFNRKFKSGTG